MRQLIYLLVTAAVIFSGCGKQKNDYLEPRTDNSFLKNAGRAVTVLSPLGMGARILVAELARDMQKIYGDDAAAENNHLTAKNSPAPTSTPSEANIIAEHPYLVKQSYYIVDGDQTYTFDAK